MINSCLVVVVKCSVEEGGLGGGEGLGKIQVSSTRDIMRDDSAWRCASSGDCHGWNVMHITLQVSSIHRDNLQLCKREVS